MVFVIVLAVSITAGAYAAWSVNSWTINKISTPYFGLSIEEDYKAPEEGVSPGMAVTKKVSVKNTGETPSLVRVRLTKAFGKKNADGEFEEDVTFCRDYIELELNENKWIYNEKDDWYYYQGILKPGEITSEPLLDRFHISESAGNEYQDLDARIAVLAESIPYEGNAVRDLWGINYAYLKTREPAKDDGGSGYSTSVTFIDEVQKFDIETSKTDLFANFKNLLPGTGRSQKILVKNEYKDSTDIRLVCMVQESGTEGNKTEATKELLARYVTIEMKDEQGQMLYAGPVGGNGLCDIDLGSFACGQTKELQVSLYVDEAMPSEYQNLLGKVRWVFEADENVRSEIVKTGDSGRLLMCGMSLLASAVLLAAAVRRHMKEDGNQSVQKDR